jgi:hypothetical protein
MHLISWHGSVICMPNADGVITHLKLPLPALSAPPMDFDAERLAERGVLRHPELGLLRVEAAITKGCVHLGRDGRYVCAESFTPVVKFDRTLASGWESWLPISEQDLADLQHILRFRWILRETRQVIRRTAIRLADGFVLQIGAHILDLTAGLTTHIAGRGGAGLPDRLVVPEGELVIAEPRSSALLETALWPVRARRTAEIVTLAAHRFMTGAEPSQQVFERDTALVQANRGAAGLSDLLEQLDGAGVVAGPPGADPRRDDVLMAWAIREMTPWLLRPAIPPRMDYVLEELNTTTAWATIYRFAGGDVTILPKPDEVMPDAAGAERAEGYLKLFQSAAQLLPAYYKATLCVCIADRVPADYGVPLFCFQKKPRESFILLPNTDVVLADFYRHERYTDTTPYDTKIPEPALAGSTQPFQQRFIISKDGNGLARSPVVIALHSHSVLMKYDSDTIQFYSGGLQPWLHYVPIAAEQNVDSIMALEPTMPHVFKRIAEGGRAFAQAYLGEDAIHRYTAMLLQLYAQAVAARPGASLAAPAVRNEAAAATTLLGHIQERGDEKTGISTWLGHVGSGLAIEGFYVALAPGLPSEGFFYQAVLADGTLSERAQSEEFCGTRGKNTPVYGVRISTEGRFAEAYEVTCEARFVDGSMVEPVEAGTVCRAETNAPLEAMRLHIFARTNADVPQETAASEA